MIDLILLGIVDYPVNLIWIEIFLIVCLYIESLSEFFFHVHILVAMSVSRLTAWAREVSTRMSQIPWREIAGEGFDKFAFLVKFACATHVANRYVFGFAYVSILVVFST